MTFIENIKYLADNVRDYLDQGIIKNEEATKRFIIVPFLKVLGYNVDDPLEFRPEYDADFQGINKKNEKVDYAIFRNNEPIIFVEAKCVSEDLEKHNGQLNRYFNAIPSAKLAILTNGISYRFFTDLKEKNNMDEKPFFTFNLLNYKDIDINEIENFCAVKFKIEDVQTRANRLKYVQATKDFITQQIKEPSDEFVKLVLRNHFNVMRSSIIDKHRETVRKSLDRFIWDLVDDRLKKATEKRQEEAIESDIHEINEDEKPKIDTTPDELELLAIIKTLLQQDLDPERISIKDTASYCNYIIDSRTRQWVCRAKLDGRKKTITIPNEDKEQIIYQISSIYDVVNFQNQLISALHLYIG